MTRCQFRNGALTALMVLVLLGTWIESTRMKADDGDYERSKIQQGFAFAPVFLNLTGKNGRWSDWAVNRQRAWRL